MSATTPDAARRFYKATRAAAEGDGFAVQLDGRTPRSPAGARLILPTLPLAELIAEEWAAQGEHIQPSSMPATRLAFTAIDQVSKARPAVAEEVARYAGSDLICYFSDMQDALAARQEAAWAPLLAWASSDLGLAFNRARGIIHTPQPEETLKQIEALALVENDFALAGLAHGAALLGSAVLILALRRGRLDGAQAFALSRIDEDFQIEQWGEDEEAMVRVKGLRAETELMARWFVAIGPTP